MIVKLQRPLAGGTEVLIYNKDRSVQGMIPMTPDLQRLFGKKPKVYAEGSFKNGIVEIDRLVPDQPW
jgi:hypothetical protein